MSQRLDFMWEQMFTKTKGSTDRGKAVKGEDEAKKSTDGNSETHRAETEQPINPILHNSTRYNPYTHVWDYHPPPRFEHAPFPGHHPAHYYRGNDITK
jgi:hypothetical protein